MTSLDIQSLFTAGLTKFFSGDSFKYHESVLDDIEHAERSRMRNPDSKEYLQFKSKAMDFLDKSKETLYS